MERNLSKRVEAVTPVEARLLRQRLWEILQINLTDQRQAWDMRPDGSYVQRQPSTPNAPGALGTHAALMTLARQQSARTS
jgi:polyphosphate kinase